MNARLTFNNPDTLAPPRGYSHLARVSGGSLILISGQVGMDPQALEAPASDFATQTHNVFANLQSAVVGAGGTFADIAKLNIYIVDSVGRNELAPLLAAINRHSGPRPPPASTLLFVSGLIAPEWLIEIEAIAVIA